MKILFSCMGTTDPVRGYHDGPLLHILRHYRPEKAVILLSNETYELNKGKKEDRIAVMSDYIRNNWGGYNPKIEVIKANLPDPSDLDAVSIPITENINRILAGEYDTELLLNLSSGTPQMKLVLAMIAANARYPHTLGIQVKNFEGKAGTTDRTNKSDYSISDELECNDDELPGSKSRCIIPEMFHLQRQQLRDEFLALLERRDYAALNEIKSLPNDVAALVGHLAARDQLQYDDAKKYAKKLRLPFSLYPKKTSTVKSIVSTDFNEVSEVFLVLLNRCHRQQYEEMILRLNPLVVRLQLHLLNEYLPSIGTSLENIIDCAFSNRPEIKVGAVEKNEILYAALTEKFGSNIRNNVSISSCNILLSAINDVPPKQLALLQCCETINKNLRDKVAHQLTAVTAEQIKDACGMEPSQLLEGIGDIITSVYSECDKKLFGIYEQCGDYIKSRLM